MSESVKDKIVGTWKLVSWTYTNEHDEVVDFFGKEPSGILMYDSHGYMNAQLMRTDRLPFAEAKALGEGTPEEITQAYKGFAAYYGKYYESAPGELTHEVEGSLFPNWIGGKETRYAKIEGEHLLLSAPPVIVKGKPVLFKVVWKRA